MKICILEAAESISACPIDAHVRQAVVIADYLKSKGNSVFLLCGETMRKCHEKNFDVIIKSYAAFYENYKDEIRIINDSPNARLFWLTNEYDLEIGGSFTKLARSRAISIIANFRDTRKMFAKHYFVNMNALFYQENKKIPVKKYDICYYGTYRRNRAKYFRRYFTDKRFMLSSSDKNFKKFKGIGCLFTPIKKLTWGGRKNYDTLGYFRYSLYIEDTVTHELFNNLADRFYEAISNSTVILFDESCLNTLQKSEIGEFDYKQFLINSFSDIEGRDFERDLAEQQKWIPTIKAEKQKALDEILKIISE